MRIEYFLFTNLIRTRFSKERWLKPFAGVEALRSCVDGKFSEGFYSIFERDLGSNFTFLLNSLDSFFVLLLLKEMSVFTISSMDFSS